MNRQLRDMIMDRISGEDHARTGRRYSGGRRSGYRRYDRNMDYEMDYAPDYRDYADDYADDYEMDGKQGVKGTGRYGIGGSRYYGRRRRRDYAGRMPFEMRGEAEWEDEDHRDYGRERGEMKLRKKDMQEWEKKLANADGSHGKHFSEHQLMPIAEKLGIKFDEYDEKEFVLVANMLYSDYCEALKSIVTPEREHIVYSKLAKAWLEDEDAAQGSEKLALYYYCIVDDEE